VNQNDSSESKRQNQEAEMFEEFDLKTREGVEALLRVSPVHNLFEFELCDLNPETGALSIRAKTTGDAARAYGAEQAHGGVIATLIDCTATFACSVALNHTVPTMGLHIDFLRPAQGGEMIASATVRKLGRTVTVVDVEVEAGGKLAAVGRATLASAQG
jgi:uncharacterized protein (TIGR00369 family)